MMKVYAEPVAGRRGARGTGGTGGGTGGGTTTLRQRYRANRAAGRGRMSSAVNALRGRTPG